jgi:alpha-beta hydrolase superfamily lysophospholipase
MFHGIGQCSDIFMELALTLSLNGIVVYMIDFEGFGFSSGNKVTGLSIEKFHH